MRNEVLYHGTDGDSILGIISTGSMLPGDGKMFFSKYQWQDSMMHGGDSKRKATFVVKVRVSIPDHVVSYTTSTSGVGVTFVVETNVSLRADVIELYVRKRTADGFEVLHLVGAQAIRQFLL